MTKEDVIKFIRDFEPTDEFERIDINKTSATKKVYALSLSVL